MTVARVQRSTLHGLVAQPAQQEPRQMPAIPDAARVVQ